MEAEKVAAERGSLRERWEGRTGETKGGRVGEGERRDRGRKGDTRNRQLGKGGEEEKQRVEGREVEQRQRSG